MAKLIVNGEPVDYRLDPATPLLWALRDASNLTGTKYGCDDRSCGACTVMIDGQAVMSCAVPIGELEGVKVTTIEGLSAGGLHPVQKAWASECATLCGFCEPGFIMAAAALVEAGSAADAAGIDALPNRCACGGAARIRKAIAKALELAAAERRNSSRFSPGSSDSAQRGG